MSDDFLIWIRLSSGIGLELRICVAKEVWLRILSLYHHIIIRIRLIIVNEMNWLVIQCGSFKGGLMGVQECRFLALCEN